MSTTRRQWQRQAIALALAPWCLPLAQPQDVARRWKTSPFALGVASGSPRADGVVLWTRLLIDEADRQADPAAAQGSRDPVSVQWALFADESLRQLVRQGEVVTDATRGHSVHVPLRDLPAGREFWYRFTCGDAVSAVGRTRTAPAADTPVQRLRMALASCQHYEQGQYIAHRDIAEQSLDFVLFVGDYIYESSNPRFLIRQHDGPEPKTLEAYRQRYAQYKRDPWLQASHAAHPWILMWDDHEVVNDYANDRDNRYSPPDVFLARRAAAYQAYFEHQPLWLGPDPTSPARASMRLHDRLSWGTLADIWTLDCRQYRDHQACPDPLKGGARTVLNCAEMEDPARSMLGRAQETWLSEGLRASRARWRLIAQSTQISPTSIATPLGRTTFNDAWDGYPQARLRLLQTIAELPERNVVTLGGDVHMNVAAPLRQRPGDPSSPVVASEFVTTSITSRGMSDNILSLIRASNPDLLHARSDERGYTLIDVRPEVLRAEFRSTPHPASASNPLRVQAAFQVLAGRPGPLPG